MRATALLVLLAAVIATTLVGASEWVQPAYLTEEADADAVLLQEGQTQELEAEDSIKTEIDALIAKEMASSGMASEDAESAAATESVSTDMAAAVHAAVGSADAERAADAAMAAPSHSEDSSDEIEADDESDSDSEIDAEEQLDAESLSLVESEAAAVVAAAAEAEVDLGAALEAQVANTEAMDIWLDQEFEAEAETDKEDDGPSPHDVLKDSPDDVLKAAPALPRDLVTIKPKPPAPKPKPPAPGAKPKSRAQKKAERKAAKAAKKAKAKEDNFVPDPKVMKKWKNVKETSVAFLNAIRKYIKTKYGKDQLAVLQKGIQVTKDVYSICKKFGKNKFLCAIIRDHFLAKYLRSDVNLRDKKTGRKFVRDVMKKIIKFTAHVKRHPEEYAYEFVNQKALRDPYQTCGRRMGREIRKFMRALRYAVAEKHPDLSHEIVSDFRSVLKVTRKKCKKLKKLTGFKHPICKVLTRMMEKKFATQDVFNDRSVRRKFVIALKKLIKKRRDAERKKKGLPKEDPKCKTKAQRKKAAAKKAQAIAIAKAEAHQEAVKEAVAKGLPPPPAPATAPAAAKQEAAAAPAAAPKTKAERKAARAAKRAARKAAREAKRQARKAKRAARRAAAKKKRAAAKKLKKQGKKQGKAKAKGKKAAAKVATKSVETPGGGLIVFNKINAAIVRDQLEVTVRLKLNYNNIASNPDDLNSFVKEFCHQVARALDIPEKRVTMVALQHAHDNTAAVALKRGAAAKSSRHSKAEADGVIVKFQISPDDSTTGVHSDPNDPKSVENLAKEFARQAQAADSGVNSQSILSKMDKTATTTLTTQKAQGSAATSAQPTVLALAVSALAVVAALAF